MSSIRPHQEDPTALQMQLWCHSPAPGRKVAGAGPVPAPLNVGLALVLSNPGVYPEGCASREGRNTQILLQQHSERQSKVYWASGAAHIRLGQTSWSMCSSCSSSLPAEASPCWVKQRHPFHHQDHNHDPSSPEERRSCLLNATSTSSGEPNVPRPFTFRTGYRFAQALSSGFMKAMGTPGPHTACTRPGRPLRQNKPSILSQEQSPRRLRRGAME